MPSIFSRIRNFLPVGGRIRYFKDDGTPKTVVRSVDRKGFAGIGSDVRTPSLLREYEKYYKTEGTVFAAINLIAYNAVMVGYKIYSHDPDAKHLIEQYCKKLDLDSFLLPMMRFALIYGDAFLEKIYNKKGQISRLKKIDPKSMIIHTNKYGEIVGYQQEIGGKKGPIIDPKYIVHFSLFDLADGPYGISLIGPAKQAIERMIKADDALTSAMIRHGTAKYVATIGTPEEGQLPPDEVLDAIKEELEDIDSKSEFIVPWNVKIETIDERGIRGIEEYYSYPLTKVVLSMMVPEEALGLGRGSTEATAAIKALLFERMIRSFQLALSRTVEKQIFNDILKSHGFEENSVEIIFNSVTDEDEAMKARWMGDLIKGFRYSKIKPLTVNEIRAVFGFKEIDEPWANTLFWDLEDVNKKRDDQDEEES